MGTISELCGEDIRILSDGTAEIEANTKFFKNWTKIQYSNQDVKFSDDIYKSEKFSLPAFSSAAVPNGSCSTSYRDFIFNVGGSVWSLDWCPQNEAIHPFKCEFVALAVHPPGSFYHKIGVPLHGLGTVQIWSIISSSHISEELSYKEIEKSRGKAKKPPIITSNKRPRGRPRKIQIEDKNIKEIAEDNFQVNLEFNYENNVSYDSTLVTANDRSATWENKPQSSEKNLASVTTWKGHEIKHPRNSSEQLNNSAPNDIALPQMVLCLAHEGRVVWDLKWKVNNTNHCSKSHHLGYLAVLLGNGSLEVWKIPSPAVVREIHSSSSNEGTDPRFVKPIPVFKCSKLMCGGVQSIPLTVEWSSSDNILVGCHDGTVALWKFSPVTNCDDTLPFLCFNADTLPIRAVAWNPLTNNEEDSNIILTAGHGGLKFWDIRDPFRALCDLHPVPRFIYSVDWVADPNCVMSAYDDGTMRLQSFTKSGFHTLNCSASAIWSVHVSKVTETVAYCSADGTVRHFELNRKAVEKDPSRHKMAHYVCSRVGLEEDGCITVYSANANRSSVDGHVAEAKDQLTMPYKKIAMQRVRWNVNEGSEHWLCSAGASGIVRCQQILPV